MRALINFFALRPVFTMRGLRLIWLLVLAQQAAYVASFFGTYGIVSITGTFGPYGSLGRPWFTIVTLLFNMALHLILVRLLIEVAAAILLRPPPVGASNWLRRARGQTRRV